LEHARFAELPDFLSPRDLLVMNDSRVLPARLAAAKETGGKVEVLLMDVLEGPVWRALLRPGRRVRAGHILTVHPDLLSLRVMDDPGAPLRKVRVEAAGDLQEILKQVGQPPLPPYIERKADSEDRAAYQTVYADRPGSVAAPTAGLHFTKGLLSHVNHCMITLHVGYGTFQPIVADRVEEHRMHSEYYEVPPEAARKIRRHRQAGGRVIAVGTTTTRVLEQVYLRRGDVVQDRGWTDLFLKPGFKFGVIDGLITNFHLPRTSLLLLVAAFAGLGLLRESYREAVARSYRFYSYGDAMLIL
jgi:S-adenosylmethionine:tRNA ribosyltransferase-isomerase